VAGAAGPYDELGHPFRLTLPVGIHGRKPLIVVVVSGEDDIGARLSKDAPQCILIGVIAVRS